MTYYSALKKKVILLYVITQMNLEDIISEINQIQKEFVSTYMNYVE